MTPVNNVVPTGDATICGLHGHLYIFAWSWSFSLTTSMGYMHT